MLYLAGNRKDNSVSLEGDDLTVRNLIKRLRRAESVEKDEKLAGLLNDEWLIGEKLSRNDRLTLGQEVGAIMEKRKKIVQDLDSQSRELSDKRQPVERDIEILRKTQNLISTAELRYLETD